MSQNFTNRWIVTLLLCAIVFALVMFTSIVLALGGELPDTLSLASVASDF